AASGLRVLSMSSTSSPGIVRQDVIGSTQVGDTVTATAWVRSGTAGVPVRASLGVSGIGGDSNEFEFTQVVANDEWQQVVATLTMEKNSHFAVRVNLRVDDPNQIVLFDQVALGWGAELPDPTEPLEFDHVEIGNPSFESDQIAPW